MKIVHRFVVFIIFIFIANSSIGSIFYFQDSTQTKYVGKYVQILEDSSGSLTIDAVRNSGKFTDSKDNILNFKITNSTFWLKVDIANDTYDPNLLLTLAYPMLDNVEFYSD